MKNFLQSFFNKKSNKKLIPYNSIEFLIEDDTPNIKLSVIDISDSGAQLLAQMICDILYGEYETDIINTLLDLSSKDDQVQKFVTQVLIYYSLYKTKYVLSSDKNIYKSDDPVIKPTSFNKYS